MALDFLGKEITVGDTVVFMQKNYRNLMRGKVTKLTQCTAMIKHDKTNMYSTETRQNHDQIIVVSELLTDEN